MAAEKEQEAKITTTSSAPVQPTQCPEALDNVQVSAEMQEVLELVLGTHWEATREIVDATVREGRQKIDSAASRRAASTKERLAQLTAEVQSKVKLKSMGKIVKQLPIDEIIVDVEAHINEVSAAVRKDHDDWLLSHLDFMDEFATYHAGSLHELLTRLASERKAELTAREARAERKKEIRIDRVAQSVTDQVRKEIQGELEARIWTQKNQMQKTELRLRDALAEERARREAAESSIETLQRAAESQVETIQLAFDQLEQSRLAAEQELADARTTITDLNWKATALAVERRDRDKRERETIFSTQEALDKTEQIAAEQAGRLTEFEEKEKRYCGHPSFTLVLQQLLCISSYCCGTHQLCAELGWKEIMCSARRVSTHLC